MRAAFGGRDRVAIGMAEPVVFVLSPDARPLAAAHALLCAIAARPVAPRPVSNRREIGLTDKRPRGQKRALGQGRAQIVAETIRKMQPRLVRHAVRAWQRRVAPPADLDAAEQIRLRAR